MIVPALVSISFRSLTPEEVIALCLHTGLQAIEWGGDVHVPHGNLRQAAKVARLTRAASLRVCCYGSYARLDGEADNPSHADLIETALALKAPVIRVWAGRKSSDEADEAYRNTVIENLAAVSDLAAQAGLDIALEYHGRTLTDTVESASALLSQVPASNVYTNWQPPNGVSLEDGLTSLRAVRDRLRDLHVFHWPNGPQDRRPLSEGLDHWRAYLAEVPPGRDRYAALEFVRNDEVSQFIQDAEVLCTLLKG